MAGLDRRFGWSNASPPIVVAAWAVFMTGTWIVFVSFRANSFAPSVIEVTAAQAPVDTGPYRVVRHPMYAGLLLMGLATPVGLGSYWAQRTTARLLPGIW